MENEGIQIYLLIYHFKERNVELEGKVQEFKTSDRVLGIFEREQMELDWESGEW